MSSKKNKKEPKETSDKPAKDKKESKKKGDVKEGSKKKEEAGGKKKVDKKEDKKEGKKGAKKGSEKAGKKKGDAKKSTKPKGGPFAKLSDPLLSNIFSFLTLEDHLIGLLGVSKRFRTLHHYPECWPPELDFDFDCGADHDHDDHDHDHGHEHFPVEAFLRALPSDNIKLLDLSYRNVDPSVLEILSKWPKLTAVNATGCEWINDENVARLASLPLKELSLSECDNINDVGVAQLKGMKLEKLELRELKITNLALDVLQGMQLKVLDLDQVTAINNQGLEKLSHLTTLETLRFGGAQIDDEGLKHLAPLSNLKELFLEDCRQLNGSGLKYLRKLPLNTLSLQGTNVTDNSLYYLTPLKLEEIDLWRCPKITEDGLVYLGGIKTLHAVSFSYLPSRVMQHFVNLKLKFLAMLGVPIDEYGLLALRRHHLAEMQLYHCNMDEDLMEALDEISPFVEINGLETCGPHIPMEPPADQFTLPEGEGLGLFGDGEEDDEDDDEDDDEEAAPFEFDFGGPTHTFGQQQSGVEITEVHDDDENEKGEGDESLPEDEEGFDAEDID